MFNLCHQENNSLLYMLILHNKLIQLAKQYLIIIKIEFLPFIENNFFYQIFNLIVLYFLYCCIVWNKFYIILLYYTHPT